MYVHQLKQEVATTWKTGSSYISYISGYVNGPSAVTLKSGVFLPGPLATSLVKALFVEVLCLVHLVLVGQLVPHLHLVAGHATMATM